MQVTVYQIPHSPYCLPVVRLLDALGVAIEITNVSNADRGVLIQLTGGAYYQVPVLAVSGSNAGAAPRLVYEGSDSSPDGLDVARFIDVTWSHGRLFPAPLDGVQAVVIPHIENELEGFTFKLADAKGIPQIADLVERTMIVRHKERRFGKGCVDRWREQSGELSSQLRSALIPYEQMLSAQPYLLAPVPVYADFALYGVLANLTYNHWNPFPAGLPRLAGWFDRIRRFSFA